MNFFTTLLEQYTLMESLDSVIKSNPHILEQTIRNYHSNALPDNNKNDRLLNHVLKMHKTGAITPETAHLLKPHLTALSNTNQLHQLKNLNTVNDHINATKDIMNKAVTKKQRVDINTPVIYDTPNLLVTQHLTHESAIKGARLHSENPMYNKTGEPGKASWCVSVGSHDGEEHYNEYTEDGKNPMYVILNKKTKRSTAMVTNKDDIYNGSEIRDEADNLVSPYGLLKDNPGIEHVKPIMDHINKYMPEVHDVIKQVPFNANKTQLMAAINSDNDNYKGAATEHNLEPYINEISNNGKMYMVHKDMHLPSEHISKLIDDYKGKENINQRKIIAHYKYLEPKHIDKLVKDDSVGIRKIMAQHDNLEPHHIDTLVGDDDISVRAYTAERKDLLPHHIDTLVGDNDPAVRRIIAQRDDLKPYHIDKLIEDDSPEVRSNLARSKALKPHHVEALINDTDDDVLQDIANSKKLKPEHIDHLFHKGSRLVDVRLIRRSDLKPHHIERYITEGTPTERGEIAVRRHLEPHYIDTLIKDTSSHVREAMAQRKHLEPHHINELINDTHRDVLRSMARRKDLEPHHIDTLLKSKDHYVRTNMKKRKDLKPYQQQILRDMDANSA